MIGSGFQNIFKIPELKKRILFTLALLIVYRIGVHVPVPGIDTSALASFFARAEGTIFGIFNMFSGGAFQRLSVFALGIMPYISASIILQLLTVVIPHLEQLKKEGEAGAQKNHPVYPIQHSCIKYYSGFWHQCRFGKYEFTRRCPGGDDTGMGI